MPDDETKRSEPTQSQEPQVSSWKTPQSDTSTDSPVDDSSASTGETTPSTPPAAEPVTTPAAPVVAPVPSSQVSPAAGTLVEEPKNSPGVLVLQWLTYAFWGWTVLALLWLTNVSVSFFVDHRSHSGSDTAEVAYPLAAVVVLFIISLVCDIFYSKREPTHKHGASTIVMIIHAVIFALAAIGSLIFSVFAMVRMLIGDNYDSYSGSSDGSMTMLITGLVIAVVYGATLLRTLRPFKLKQSSLLYWVFMTIVTISITALAIAGPTVYARQTKDDRLIENSLPQVSEAIRAYTKEHDALPGSLADIKPTASDGARTLIDQNLVEYSPGVKIATMDLGSENGLRSDSVYRYTLCVDYKDERGSGSIRPSSDDVNPSTYSHAAGRTCYKLKTDYMYDSKY